VILHICRWRLDLRSPTATDDMVEISGGTTSAFVRLIRGAGSFG
jgi:hypothetical protein